MAHIHEKIDFTVEAFIVYQDKVLLRFHDKYKIWLSVGGHVELDEDPNQAIIREVKEEVGLDIKLHNSTPEVNRVKIAETFKSLIPPSYLNIHQINETHQHCSMVYFATADSDKIVAQYQSDKSEKCIWCTEGEIDKIDGASEITKFYAKQALKILSSKIQ